MITITFEIDEKFVRENATTEAATKRVEKNPKDAMKAMFNMVACKQFCEQLDKGKTEFVVKPEKLDETSQKIYENSIFDVCLLASFSETDKPAEN